MLPLLAIPPLLVLLAGLCRGWFRASGSTLRGPIGWSIAATVGVLVATQLPHEAAAAWRFALAVGVFCPALAVMGAKRPQHAAWHFIVGSLWAMLALPAAEVIFLKPGQQLAIDDVREWFLVVLIAVSVLIYLPTRNWLAAIAVGVGQAALFWNYLPSVSVTFSPWQDLVASYCFCAALVWALRPASPAPRPFDQLWLDFRDQFGAFWSARLLERVNAAAVQKDWPFRLGWSGFHVATDATLPATIEPQYADELRQIMANLLRRFVAL